MTPCLHCCGCDLEIENDSAARGCLCPGLCNAESDTLAMFFALPASERPAMFGHWTVDDNPLRGEPGLHHAWFGLTRDALTAVATQALQRHRPVGWLARGSIPGAATRPPQPVGGPG